MSRWEFTRRLPGYIATGLVILVTTFWMSWGVQEMFHEGWYRPFDWMFFLLPGGGCLALTFVVLTWPWFGGWLLIAIGGAFNALWWWRYSVSVGLSLGELLSMFPLSGLLAFVGVLFLFEGRRRRRVAGPSSRRWWQRNLRYLVAMGIPVVVGIGLTIEPAIRVSGRVDDGYRGERIIEGNDVTLTWAPTGPGWATSTRGSTWNEIALYGVSPIGFEDKERGRNGQCTKDADVGCPTAADMQLYNVCRYLSRDATTLMDAPQNFWRMPTTDELVRSLVRHGENAGCMWNAKSGRQPCDILPDKETPLWDPTMPVISYWAADEHDARIAYQVAYNGTVGAIRKFRGDPNFGYRCVRDR